LASALQTFFRRPGDVLLRGCGKGRPNAGRHQVIFAIFMTFPLVHLERHARLRASDEARVLSDGAEEKPSVLHTLLRTAHECTAASRSGAGVPRPRGLMHHGRA
jgi:hypothetical protein